MKVMQSVLAFFKERRVSLGPKFHRTPIRKCTIKFVQILCLNKFGRISIQTKLDLNYI
jgi:hypothetical protein